MLRAPEDVRGGLRFSTDCLEWGEPSIPVHTANPGPKTGWELGEQRKRRRPHKGAGMLGLCLALILPIARAGAGTNVAPLPSAGTLLAWL